MKSKTRTPGLTAIRGGADAKELIKEAANAFKRVEEVIDRLWESDRNACVITYTLLDMPLSSKMHARMDTLMSEIKEKRVDTAVKRMDTIIV